MKKRIFVYGLILITIGVIVFEGYSIVNMVNNHKNKVLQDIKTVDIFENKDKALSIMIQQPDYSYKEDTSRTAWPSTSEYLYSGAKCTYQDGSEIVDTGQYISFEEISHTATITTKKTIYCTLYFANGRPALEVLKATNDNTYAGGGQHTTVVEGLYRFKGDYDKVLNNYICLGAYENPEKCKTNANNMYRIIGVTDGTEESTLGLKAGMLKVIKATPSNTSQAWSSSGNYDWDNTNATARKYLNDTFYTGNTIDARIKPYIAEVNWWKGDNEGSWLTPPTSETKTKTTSQYRIGLMYASDYYNSWTYSSSGNTNSWLDITHGLSSSSTYSNYIEWTMTKYGSSYAWYVRADGALLWNNINVTNAYAVRPVFYLSSTAGLIGFGTEQQPYTITTIK